MRLPRRWNRETRRLASRSRICWETLGCEIPSRSAARLKLPAFRDGEEVAQMSNGERIVRHRVSKLLHLI